MCESHKLHKFWCCWCTDHYLDLHFYHVKQNKKGRKEEKKKKKNEGKKKKKKETWDKCKSTNAMPTTYICSAHMYMYTEGHANNPWTGTAQPRNWKQHHISWPKHKCAQCSLTQEQITLNNHRSASDTGGGGGGRGGRERVWEGWQPKGGRKWAGGVIFLVCWECKCTEIMILIVSCQWQCHTFHNDLNICCMINVNVFIHHKMAKCKQKLHTAKKLRLCSITNKELSEMWMYWNDQQ